MNVTFKFQSRPPLTLYSLKMYWHWLHGAVRRIKKSRKQKIVIAKDELRAWMIGHASVLINFYGTTILTDPVFVNWLPMPKRILAPGYAARDMPKIDFVLISHAHIDHLNRRSLRRIIHKSGMVIVPKNCTDLIPRRFRHIVELPWNRTHVFKNLSIKAFKPRHWGERYFWEHKNRGYNSYILQKNGRSIFFCGDSAYDDFFKKIGRRYRPDVAFLPIGAYAPNTMRNVHMDPYDAMQAFRDLQARDFIPIHWGNFRLSLEKPEEPPQILNTVADTDGTNHRIHVLRNGESIAFPNA